MTENKCRWCGKRFKNPLKYEKTRDSGETWSDCCTRCATKVYEIRGHWLAGNLDVREKIAPKKELINNQ